MRANGSKLIVSESNDGEFGSFRLGGQLEMVHAHEYHLILEQSRSLPTEARSIASEQLLPRLLRWQRCQQSSKVLVVEVQSGQSCSS